MESLCDGLQHPQCPIETLRLSGDIWTESCSRDLAEVFRTNQRLRELHIYIDDMDGESLELFWDEFRYEQCPIKTFMWDEEYVIQNGTWNVRLVHNYVNRIRRTEKRRRLRVLEKLAEAENRLLSEPLKPE
ncbi:NACHT, LRR and PYD domains-containing protein 12-like [Thamnophis elegans]|uniref:NACHT, LRR and PYD domains-containing protein 12-like n=1 Tax=Thamnophis elegans TaxID=35005 RepID=UPI001376C5F9|nr:NACHT, LRR and PYD domains-containing protein 12-like [Thamnophis elegans]